MKPTSLKGVGVIVLFVVFLISLGVGVSRSLSPEARPYILYNQCMETLKESKSVTPETMAECKTLLPRQ